MIRKETPDELLERLKYEESINSRGRLKIFFGYAAGVGKTYAMLSAAHDLKKQGIDVVIGYICLLYTSSLRLSPLSLLFLAVSISLSGCYFLDS